MKVCADMHSNNATCSKQSKKSATYVTPLAGSANRIRNKICIEIAYEFFSLANKRRNHLNKKIPNK